MAGLNTSLNIANLAVSAHQYAISVTSQNVANVDNDHYTRQCVDMATTGTIKNGGIAFGTGVKVDQVISECNSYLTDALYNKTNALASSEEMALYMSAIETIFGSTTETGLNYDLSEFWNAWSDLSNNPSGDAERILVYESGVQLAQSISNLHLSLNDVKTNLNLELETAVNQVNTLSQAIADLNVMIRENEANGARANDLRDQRNSLYSELTTLTGCQCFEAADGTLSVMTAEGFPLVTGECFRTLSYASGQILWNGSDGDVDITDDISGGRFNGWLEVRDVLIPEYQAELDSLAESLIYEINLLTSQGMGTDYYSRPITGMYQTDSSGLLSTMDFASELDTSADFVLWIENSSGSTPSYTSVPVDLSSAAPVTSPTMDVSGTANAINSTYAIKLDPPTGVLGGAADVTVSWSSDYASGEFTVAAGDLSTTYDIDGMTFSLSAASGPFTGGTFTITTNDRGHPTENVSGYTLSDLAADINTEITAAGGGATASVVDNRLVLTPDSADYALGFSNDNGTESGLAAILGINTFFTGTTATNISVNDLLTDNTAIQCSQIDQTTGIITSGNNDNALLIASFQDSVIETRNWTFRRGEAATSAIVSGTTAESIQTIVSSVGTKTMTINLTLKADQEMVAFLQSQRDSVSAVSLDEEMINLTKFQTSYSAALKLVSVLDEMLNELLTLR